MQTKKKKIERAEEKENRKENKEYSKEKEKKYLMIFPFVSTSINNFSILFSNLNYNKYFFPYSISYV